MISRNRFIEAELVEQRTLLVVLTPHHRPSPTKKCRQKTESLFAKAFKSLLQQNLPVASFFRAAPNTAPLFVHSPASESGVRGAGVPGAATPRSDASFRARAHA